MAIKEVSERYLELRQNALDYTFEQMNLQLENDKQVYLAVFDIPCLLYTSDAADEL